jgi:hypothetical protein
VDDYAWGVEIEGEDQWSVPASSVMTPELGRYVMEQAIAKLLFHSGFEGMHSLQVYLTFRFPSFGV